MTKIKICYFLLSQLHVLTHMYACGTHPRVRERERPGEGGGLPREGLRKTARAEVSLNQRMATLAPSNASKIFSSSVVRVFVGKSYSTRTCLVPKFAEHKQTTYYWE